MIQITAYLQTPADKDLWKQIPNKSQWLHDHLNQKEKVDVVSKPTPSIDEIEKTLVHTSPQEKPLTSSQLADKAMQEEKMRRLLKGRDV